MSSSSDNFGDNANKTNDKRISNETGWNNATYNEKDSNAHVGSSENDDRHGSPRISKFSQSSNSSSDSPIFRLIPNSLSRYASTDVLVPSILIAGSLFGLRFIYAKYLRRIRETRGIGASEWRRRSLLGVVTSVGDGDGFRLFHTPGGRLAGWGWLPWRRVPSGRAALKGNTISVRLAGVDAPEAAHFGQPGQPGGKEAHVWLQRYLTGRRVRAHVWRRDQYDRAVATAVRLTWAGLWRRDVGLVMLQKGLATVYEAKSGAEFGGREHRYRRAEARARWWRRGIWGMKHAETPREFKDRMKARDGGDHDDDDTAQHQHNKKR